MTALSPVIGYDEASAITHKAFDEKKTLREAALESGSIGAGELEKIVMPAHMVGDPHKVLKQSRKVFGLSGLKKERNMKREGEKHESNHQ